MLSHLKLHCQGRICRKVYDRLLLHYRSYVPTMEFLKVRDEVRLPLSKFSSTFSRKQSNVATVCSALTKSNHFSDVDNRELNVNTNEDSSSFLQNKEMSNEIGSGSETYNLPVYRPADKESAESFIKLPLKCRSCGAFMQTQDPTVKGYILPKKLPSLLRKNSLEDLICSNCFSLRYANKALNFGIDRDNVHWQLKPMKKSRALILYVVDIMDIHGSIMPEIMQLIGENKNLIIVGNKLDMLSCDNVDKSRRQENYVANVVKKYCIDEGLDEKVVKDVCLVSGVTGYGFEKLVVLINKHREVNMNIYVVGSTNVGKSTIFNMLQNLTAISKDATIPTQAITHRIPGSTYGLVRHPLAYWRMKKVRKMLLEKPPEDEDEKEQIFEFVEDIIKDIKPSQKLGSGGEGSEMDDEEKALDRLVDHNLSEFVDLHSLEKQRRWMYDTPSLLNTQQITQFLTPPELKFIQHQRWIVPKTFLLSPGRSLLLGGLARIDYCEITRKSLSDPSQYEEIPKGSQSVFFTVFCSHNIPIHPTEIEKASDVYERNFGNHILKIPFGDDNRRQQFPELQPKEYELTGTGWEESCADLSIAGIGWISVTAGKGSILKLSLHTPNGIGQAQRDQCLMPHVIKRRGKRGVRYAGVYNKYIYECTRKKNPQLIASFERQNEIVKAWLKKVKEKQKYQRFELKQERRRLLLEQGIKGKIRQYEETLALIDQEAANIKALESGAN